MDNPDLGEEYKVGAPGIDGDGFVPLEVRLYLAERMLIHCATQSQLDKAKRTQLESEHFNACLQKACQDTAAVGLIPEQALSATRLALRADSDFCSNVCQRIKKI